MRNRFIIKVRKRRRTEFNQKPRIFIQMVGSICQFIAAIQLSPTGAVVFRTPKFRSCSRHINGFICTNTLIVNTNQSRIIYQRIIELDRIFDMGARTISTGFFRNRFRIFRHRIRPPASRIRRRNTRLILAIDLRKNFISEIIGSTSIFKERIRSSTIPSAICIRIHNGAIRFITVGIRSKNTHIHIRRSIFIRIISMAIFDSHIVRLPMRIHESPIRRGNFIHSRQIYALAISAQIKVRGNRERSMGSVVYTAIHINISKCAEFISIALLHPRPNSSR